MPGGRDYNQQRPPRRKSWEDRGEQGPPLNNENRGRGNYSFNEDEDEDDKSYDKNYTKNYDRPDNNGSQTRNQRLSRRFGGGKEGDEDEDDGEYGGKGQRRRETSTPSPYSAAFGVDRKNTDDKKTEKKSQKKRLIKLVGNEVLCLAIIFAMIAAFNWTATDFSGDYMGRNRQIGPVRLSIARRSGSLEGELDYGRHGFLNMVEGQDQDAPQSGKPFTANFVETAQWHRSDFIPWRASFTGRIEGGQATGLVTDRTGQYKVTMEKNVLTSLFRQTQNHIPQVPAVPLPSLFNEKDKEIRGVVGTDGGASRGYSQNPAAQGTQTQGLQGVQGVQGVQGGLQNQERRFSR